MGKDIHRDAGQYRDVGQFVGEDKCKHAEVQPSGLCVTGPKWEGLMDLLIQLLIEAAANQRHHDKH